MAVFIRKNLWIIAIARRKNHWSAGLFCVVPIRFTGGFRWTSCAYQFVVGFSNCDM